MENREKLQLTTQMLSELGRIDARIETFYHRVYMPMMTSRTFTPRLVNTAIAELNTFKVLLENMLCETDIKAKSSLIAAV